MSERQWNELSDQAVVHGVAPLVYRRLHGTAAEATAPPSATRALRDISTYTALRNTAIFEELSDVLTAIQSAGMPVIVLKGAHLAEVVYSDRALRPMADVDLLGRVADLARIEGILWEKGYRPSAAGVLDYSEHQHLPPFVKRGAIPIELHRALTPLESPFRLDVDDLWSRARAATIAGVDALTLSPEDLILYLCTHAAYNHRFAVALRTLFDIAISIRHYRPALDWAVLVTIANADGRSRFVYSTLALVREMLGADIPAGVLDSLGHDAADHEVVAAVRQYLQAPRSRLPAAYERLGECKGALAKVRVVAHSLFPAPASIRTMYGLPAESRLAFCCYLFRPLDLLVRRGPTIAALLLRMPRLQPLLERDENRRTIERWCAGDRRDSRSRQPILKHRKSGVRPNPVSH